MCAVVSRKEERERERKPPQKKREDINTISTTQLGWFVEFPPRLFLAIRSKHPFDMGGILVLTPHMDGVNGICGKAVPTSFVTFRDLGASGRRGRL